MRQRGPILTRMQSCIPNIGPRGRRRRLAFGLAALAVAAMVAVLLAGSSGWLRALLFLPLLGAAHGIFQYLEKT